jgi:diguanylate cyclase (GGDEF)-like protein
VGERPILFLDVNGFKRINDSFGHAAGNRFIAAIAARLAYLAEPGMQLARMAGDEFVFVVTGAPAEFRIHDLADSFRAVLQDGFDLPGQRIRTSVDMSYDVPSPPDISGGNLVRKADLAMCEAKRCRTTRPAVARLRLPAHRGLVRQGHLGSQGDAA